MKIYLRKKDGVLTPSDKHSQTLIEGLKEGTVYRADVVKPRHLPFHNKYWVMLKVVIENTDYFGDMSYDKSKDLLHSMVKFGVGHIQMAKVNGVPIALPKSINFESMDNIEFEDFYNKARDYLATDRELNVGWLKDWEDF